MSKRICPVCQNPVPANAKRCDSCGEALMPRIDQPGTLNSFEPFVDADTADDPTVAQPSGTLNVHDDLGDPLRADAPRAEEPHDAEAVGGSLDSLPPGEYADQAAASAAAREPLMFGDSGEAAQSAEPDASVESDDHGTLNLQPPAAAAGQGKDDRRTLRLGYGEPDSPQEVGTRETREFGSSVPPKALSVASGTDDSLRQVWAEAVGSSNKDSKESLRHDRAEASDTIFRRVSHREVVDANMPEAAKADYQIQDKIGQGGMGIIYSAIQTAVNRTVAIKAIKAEKAKDPSSRRQFFYEAEVTAVLDHPNIPPIYELGVSKEGIYFYSMKLIKGSDWQQVIAEKSLEENLEIFRKIADAVAFAHSRNIIHRDLKPDNVIIGSYGEVYLTDWGLGVDLSQRNKISFGGTPDFMAPEMANNKSREVGKTSDVYLLGAVLYQVLTGKPPHVGATVYDRLHAARVNAIVPTDVQDPLLEIAYKAMSTQPADRYKSVAAMQAAIKQVLEHNDSIELSNRSAELAVLATKNNDYDQFNRAIYGYRDALELWPENKQAAEGLKGTRLALGQAAFDRGDYDLAIDTLDANDPAEAMLLGKAEKAKEAVAQREARFRGLKRTFVGALVVFLLCSSVLAGIAWREKERAESETERAIAATAEVTRQKGLVETNAAEAVRQAEIAERNAETAKANELKAQANAKEAQRQKALADQNAAEAQTQATLAKSNEAEALRNLDEANRQKKLADENAKEAERQRVAAVQQRELAEERAAQIQIASNLSRLSLANSQLNELNPIGAATHLSSLESDDIELFNDYVPKTDHWAARRVRMLSNVDLPKQAFGASVSAIALASGADRGVVGTADGVIHAVTVGGEAIEILQSTKDVADVVIAAAVSSDGKEATVATRRGDGSAATYELFAWTLDGQSSPKRVEVAENRSFQTLSYSPDGQFLLAGLNGGVWLKTANDDLKPVVNNIRGQMVSAAWLDGGTAVLLTTLNGNTHLFQIAGLGGNAPTATAIAVGENIPATPTAIAAVGGRQLLVGLENGEMLVAEIGDKPIAKKRDAGSAANDKDAGKLPLTAVYTLPRGHRAAVRQIVAGGGERLVSRSDEPAAHVWRLEDGRVNYETFVSGSPNIEAEASTSVSNNIATVAFGTDGRLMLSDTAGSAVLLDVDLQQRQRVLTRAGDGGAGYTSPVIDIHSLMEGQRVLTVCENGVVDTWNLGAGLKGKGGEERFVYFGHSPGSQFVDVVVDPKSGLVMTSATLGSVDPMYLSHPSHNRQFCVWDQKTGRMLRRWSDRDEKTPRLSFVGDGQILVNSERTKIIDFAGKPIPGSERFAATDPVFAIVHPTDPSLVAIVKTSQSAGNAWIWDKQTDAWFIPDRNEASFGAAGAGVPLAGAWSRDGARLYIILDTGRVSILKLNDRRLSVGGSFSLNIAASRKLQDYHDVDFAVDDIGGSDELVIGIRVAGASPATIMSTYHVDGDGSVKELGQDTVDGYRWIAEMIDGRQPRLNERFALRSELRGNILDTQRVGNSVYVTTRRGLVYQVNEQAAAPISFGSLSVRDSTVDASGKRLVTLHADGQLLQLPLDEITSEAWRPVGMSVSPNSEISLDADGRLLAVVDSESGVAQIIDLESGAEIKKLEGVARCLWDGSGEKSLVVVFRDGSIVSPSLPVLTEQQLELAGRRVVNAFMWAEHWQSPTLAPTRYLVVQSVGEDGGRLDFVPTEPSQAAEVAATDGEGAEAVVEQVTAPKIFLASIPADAILAPSSGDSLIAGGDSTGTILIYFASPRYGLFSAVFDMDSDRDSAIRSIAFTEGGDTLVASDDKNRLYAWLSRRP